MALHLIYTNKSPPRVTRTQIDKQQLKLSDPSSNRLQLISHTRWKPFTWDSRGYPRLKCSRSTTSLVQEYYHGKGLLILSPGCKLK